MAPKRSRSEAEAAGRAKRLRVALPVALHHSGGGVAEDSAEGVLWRAAQRAPATALDPRLAERDAQELLRRFLAPLEPSEFMRTCWARRAAAIQGPPSRIRTLARDFLHDLELPALLADTPSESIHVWLRQRSTEPSTQQQTAAASRVSGRRSTDTTTLQSVAVDADAALGLSKVGAALYFRAPEELESLLVPGLAFALGTAFAGLFPGDRRPRGEIETFVAGPGHVTGWHTDFQHNFTVQLKGAKTWRFKRGPVKHNLRPLTPHYHTRSNYEMQMKMHLTSDPASPDFRPPESFFEDAEEVTLSAGAVLYHPAGIWHRVETVGESSISINISLSTAPWAELIGNGLQQLLWASPVLRSPVVDLAPLRGAGLAATTARTRKALEAILADVRRRVAGLTAEDLLPPAALEVPQLPRHVNVATSRLGAALAVRPGDRFYFSRLAVVVELPQGSAAHDGNAASSSSEDSENDNADDGSANASGEVSTRGAVGAHARRLYALHLNFGNEDVASWLRVRLAVPAPLSGIMEWLRDHHLAARCQEEAELERKRVNAEDMEEEENDDETGASLAAQLGVFTGRELLAAVRGPGAPRAPAGLAAHWSRVSRLLRILCHCGYLHKVSNSRTHAMRVNSQGRRRQQPAARRVAGSVGTGAVRQRRHQVRPQRGRSVASSRGTAG